MLDAIIIKEKRSDKAFSVADRDKLLNQADVEIVKTLGSFIVNEINPDDVKKNFD